MREWSELQDGRRDLEARLVGGGERHVEQQPLRAIDHGFTEEAHRARDALLNDALAAEEGLEENQPAADLLGLDGMDDATAFALAERGVRTREDLAEMATDEIADIEEMGEERAAALIMEARKHWFE